MSRKSKLGLGFLFLVVCALPACQVTVPDKITVGVNGNGGSTNPTCSATPSVSTVASGTPVAITVNASGNGPFTTPGVAGTFTSSTTLSRTYTNTSSTQSTENDEVTVTDVNGNSGTCSFSVNITPAGGSVGGALSCVLTATPNVVALNGQVNYEATGSGGTAPLTFSNFNPGTSATTVVSFTQTNATQGTGTYSYGAVGLVTASVNVSDSAGNTATCQQSVEVAQAPSISVQAPTGTLGSNQTATLVVTTSNFPSTPTITYTAQNSSGTAISGVTITPNAAGTQATVADTSAAALTFNVLVKATSGSATASVLVPLAFSSTPAELVCNLTFPEGIYYVGSVVQFTASSSEPLEITSVTAQNGNVTTSSLPNPFSVDFTAAGSSVVSVQAKGLVSGTVCNNGVAMQQTLYINNGSGGSGGSGVSCNLTTSANPAVSGTSFLATVTPSSNDGTLAITAIDTDQTVSGYYSLVSGNNLEANVTISTVGTFLLSATITDSATGKTSTCSLQQAIVQ